MRQRSESVRQARAERYLERARELYIGKPGETGFVGYDLRKALINATRALMLSPNSYDALVLTGNIISDLDESEDGLRSALTHYDRAISLNPARADAYDAKAMALFDAQDFTSAVAPAWKAWRLTLADSSADGFDIETTTVYLRDTLAKLRHWNSARKVLEKALDRVPESPWLLRLLELTKKRIEWAPSEDAPPTKRLRRVK
jgi:tetratricopeptide (TPR) repeat protein